MANIKLLNQALPRFMKPSQVQAHYGIRRSAIYAAAKASYRGDFPKPLRLAGGP